jgi:hypothetical protein
MATRGDGGKISALNPHRIGMLHRNPPKCARSVTGQGRSIAATCAERQVTLQFRTEICSAEVGRSVPKKRPLAITTKVRKGKLNFLRSSLGSPRGQSRSAITTELALTAHRPVVALRYCAVQRPATSIPSFARQCAPCAITRRSGLRRAISAARLPVPHLTSSTLPRGGPRPAGLSNCRHDGPQYRKELVPTEGLLQNRSYFSRRRRESSKSGDDYHASSEIVLKGSSNI